MTFGAGTGTWTCPHCTDHETYSTVGDADLLAYGALARGVGTTDFGEPADAKRPEVLLWGARPECVYVPANRCYDIYLASGSDPWQARLQIGHEMFHRLAGGGRIFHWTHEMLACLFSVRLLRQSGLGDYAGRVARQYAREAESYPLASLLCTDPWSDATYPPGYYGRAFVTGVALRDAAGYSALCRLARTLDRVGVPDALAWRESLGGAERNAVEVVLSNNP